MIKKQGSLNLHNSGHCSYWAIQGSTNAKKAMRVLAPWHMQTYTRAYSQSFCAVFNSQWMNSQTWWRGLRCSAQHTAPPATAKRFIRTSRLSTHSAFKQVVPSPGAELNASRSVSRGQSLHQLLKLLLQPTLRVARVFAPPGGGWMKINTGITHAYCKMREEIPGKDWAFLSKFDWWKGPLFEETRGLRCCRLVLKGIA